MRVCSECSAPMIEGITPMSAGWCSKECDLDTVDMAVPDTPTYWGVPAHCRSYGPQHYLVLYTDKPKHGKYLELRVLGDFIHKSADEFTTFHTGTGVFEVVPA